MEVRKPFSEKERIELPVRYDQEKQKIFDSRNLVICNLHEWEKIHTINEPQERQKATGLKVAKLLNEMNEDQKATNEEKIISLNIPTPAFQKMAEFEWD